MSIVGQNKVGLAAFVDRLKSRGVQQKDPTIGLNKEKLFIEWKRTDTHNGVKAKRGTIWYLSKIKCFDSAGNEVNGECPFNIPLKQERALGREVVKMELNKQVAEKMKLLLDFKKVNS